MGRLHLDELLETCTNWIWRALKVQHFYPKTGESKISKV